MKTELNEALHYACCAPISITMKTELNEALHYACCAPISITMKTELNEALHYALTFIEVSAIVVPNPKHENGQICV